MLSNFVELPHFWPLDRKSKPLEMKHAAIVSRPLGLQGKVQIGKLKLFL